MKEKFTKLKYLTILLVIFAISLCTCILVWYNHQDATIVERINYIKTH